MLISGAAGDGDDRQTRLLAVRKGTTCFEVCLGERALPILRSGEPVTTFLPGWRPSIVYAGFAPLFILELEHEDGSRVSWFLDARFQHLCDDIPRLQQDLLAHLRFHAAPLLRSMLAAVLVPTDGDLAPSIVDFFALNENTRRDIADVCVALVAQTPDPRLLEPGTTDLAAYLDSRGLPGLFTLQTAGTLLRAELEPIYRAFLDVRPEAVRTQPMLGDFRIDGAVAIDDFHFAIRLVRASDDLVLFLIVGDHLSTILGCWFPAGNLLLFDKHENRDIVDPIAAALPPWFVRHVAAWTLELVPYLARGARRLASVMRGHPSVHIGHQLWNELSGIDAALRDGFDPIPEWIVPTEGPSVEIYGAIDELFPELHGKVNRSLRTVSDIIGHAYRNDILLCRLTSDHVSAGLRDRITRHAREKHPILAERDGPPDGGPIILFGLRVENRTLVDLPGFLSRLCAAVAERYPTATMVLDGHNSTDGSDDGAVISSHAENRSSIRPIDVERAIVAGLKDRFDGTGITIIDTIGAPIGASLAWAEASDCFVSIWGASLAKYRWACNKTGYTMIGRMNLLHRGDLHIYDLPIYMEAPTGLHFPDPDSVIDEPDSIPLVDVARHSWALFNFSVDETVIIPDIVAFVATTLAENGRQAAMGRRLQPTVS